MEALGTGMQPYHHSTGLGSAKRVISVVCTRLHRLQIALIIYSLHLALLTVPQLVVPVKVGGE